MLPNTPYKVAMGNRLFIWRRQWFQAEPDAQADRQRKVHVDKKWHSSDGVTHGQVCPLSGLTFVGGENQAVQKLL